MLFDTHAHVTDEKFDADRPEVINGVDYLLECATEPGDFDRVLALAETYKGVYAAVGVHPHSAAELNARVLARIKSAASRSKVKAVGEIGLDYHYDFTPKDVQREALTAQLELAKQLMLPVSLHNRESTADMLDILRQVPGTKGIMHCFSGSRETAKILLDMGLNIGFGGSLTFKNASRLLEVAAYVPEDRIVVETDCPYMTPEPLRGKRNVPGNVRLVIEKLAAIRGADAETMSARVFENAVKILNIKEDHE